MIVFATQLPDTASEWSTEEVPVGESSQTTMIATELPDSTSSRTPAGVAAGEPAAPATPAVEIPDRGARMAGEVAMQTVAVETVWRPWPGCFPFLSGSGGIAPLNAPANGCQPSGLSYQASRGGVSVAAHRLDVWEGRNIPSPVRYKRLPHLYWKTTPRWLSYS